MASTWITVKTLYFEISILASPAIGGCLPQRKPYKRRVSLETRGGVNLDADGEKRLSVKAPGDLEGNWLLQKNTKAQLCGETP